jgi:hypothetical protein
MQRKLLGIISVDFNNCYHISRICQILEKKREYNKAMHQLFIDFNNIYDSVRKEVLYNTLNESDIP